MLKIRREQMEVFSKFMLKLFEDRILILLERNFPERCEEMGEQTVRDSIKKGIEDAAGYGIKIEYDVARYICLLFILGPNFDIDTRYPWTSEILNDGTLHSTVKLDMLDQSAETRLQPTNLR